MTTQDEGLSTTAMVAVGVAGLALIGLGSWALGKEEKSPASMATSPHEIQHLRLGPDGRTYFLWGEKWVPQLDKERLAPQPAMASRLGSGERFRRLEHELAGRPGVYDPAGLAAYIGRRKYSPKKFAELSKKGRARHAR